MTEIHKNNVRQIHTTTGENSLFLFAIVFAFKRSSRYVRRGID